MIPIGITGTDAHAENPKKAFYQYYSTQRPVDIGTYPKPAENLPLEIINYDGRIQVERGAFLAWGELRYAKPLTARQQSEYELRPSRNNRDVRRRMDTQAQIVGRWERRNHVPEAKRLTWRHSVFGPYVPGDHVTPEELAERCRLAGKYPDINAGVKRKKSAPTPDR